MAGDSRGDHGNEGVCPNCGNSNLTWDYAKGEVVCTKCGTVVRKKSFDRGPEWRAFDQEEAESRSRGGPPTTNTLHDKGLSTEISPRNRDARGNSLSPERRSEMYRVRRWNRRSKTSAGKSRYLQRAFSKIKRAGSQLQLPRTVQEHACYLYRKASKADLIKGRPIENMIAAALYEACKWIGCRRNYEEICSMIPPATEKGAKKSDLLLAQNVDVKQKIAGPGAFISKFCRKLKVPNRVREIAYRIAGEVSRSDFEGGYTSRTLSAAVVYLASLVGNEKRKQSLVEEATGVSRASFSNAVLELKEVLGEKGGEIGAPLSA